MPKQVANFYWGNKILPFLRYMTLYSFRRYNPEWIMNLYYPKELQVERSWTSPEHGVELEGKDYSSRLENLDINQIPFDMEEFGLSNLISEVKKSDLLRWHLLSTQPGLWSDMDIVFIKPVPRLDNTISLHNHTWNIGFLSSNSLAKPFFSCVYNKSLTLIHMSNYQSIGSSMLKSMFGGNFNCVRLMFPQADFHNLPENVVYPMKFSESHLIFEDVKLERIEEATIGVHWFAGEPLSGKYQNLMDDQTYTEYKNTMAVLLQKVLQ